MAAHAIDLRRAKILLDDPQSCVEKVPTTEKIILPPSYIGNVKNGVRRVLDSKIKCYYDRLEGVVMTYENVFIASRCVECVADQAALMFDIKVDFIVFRPRIGSALTGIVNKLSRDHIGCLVHECFNVSLSKHDLTPKDEIRLGDEVLFEVSFADLHSRIIFMRGKFKSVINAQEADLPEETNDVGKSLSVSSLDEGIGISLNEVGSLSSNPSTVDEKKKKSKRKGRGQGVSDDSHVASSSSMSTKRKHKSRSKRKVDVEATVSNDTLLETPAKLEKLKNGKRKRRMTSVDESKDEETMSSITDDSSKTKQKSKRVKLEAEDSASINEKRVYKIHKKKVKSNKKANTTKRKLKSSKESKIKKKKKKSKRKSP